MNSESFALKVSYLVFPWFMCSRGVQHETCFLSFAFIGLLGPVGCDSTKDADTDTDTDTDIDTAQARTGSYTDLELPVEAPSKTGAVCTVCPAGEVTMTGIGKNVCPMDIDIETQACVFHSGSILGGPVGGLFLNQCGITQSDTTAAGATMEDTESLGTLTPGKYTISLQFTDPATRFIAHDITVQ
jgi:hypothetical protein